LRANFRDRSRCSSLIANVARSLSFASCFNLSEREKPRLAIDWLRRENEPFDTREEILDNESRESSV